MVQRNVKSGVSVEGERQSGRVVDSDETIQVSVQLYVNGSKKG